MSGSLLPRSGALPWGVEHPRTSSTAKARHCGQCLSRSMVDHSTYIQEREGVPGRGARGAKSRAPEGASAISIGKP
jgi:hypothetical protein